MLALAERRERPHSAPQPAMLIRFTVETVETLIFSDVAQTLFFIPTTISLRLVQHSTVHQRTMLNLCHAFPSSCLLHSFIPELGESQQSSYVARLCGTHHSYPHLSTKE